MDQKQIVDEHYMLERFHYWLTYCIYSGALLFAAIFLPLFIGLPIIVIVIAGFSVYLIRSLNELEKKGWIAGFGALMFSPLLLAIIFTGSDVFGRAVWFFPLSIFYSYCWFLRNAVAEWMGDIGDEKVLKLRDRHEREVKKMIDKSRRDSF